MSKTLVEQTWIANPSFEWIAQKSKNSLVLKHNSTGLVTQDIQTHIRTSHAHIYALLCFLREGYFIVQTDLSFPLIEIAP